MRPCALPLWPRCPTRCWSCRRYLVNRRQAGLPADDAVDRDLAGPGIPLRALGARRRSPGASSLDAGAHTEGWRLAGALVPPLSSARSTSIRAGLCTRPPRAMLPASRCGACCVSMRDDTTQRRCRPETEGRRWKPVLRLAPPSAHPTLSRLSPSMISFGNVVGRRIVGMMLNHPVAAVWAVAVLVELVFAVMLMRR